MQFLHAVPRDSLKAPFGFSLLFLGVQMSQTALQGYESLTNCGKPLGQPGKTNRQEGQFLQTAPSALPQFVSDQSKVVSRGEEIWRDKKMTKQCGHLLLWKFSFVKNLAVIIMTKQMVTTNTTVMYSMLDGSLQ